MSLVAELQKCLLIGIQWIHSPPAQPQGRPHTPTCVTHTRTHVQTNSWKTAWQQDLPHWSLNLSALLPFPRKPHRALLRTPRVLPGWGRARTCCSAIALTSRSVRISQQELPVNCDAWWPGAQATLWGGFALGTELHKLASLGVIGQNRNHGAGEERNATGLWALFGRAFHELGVSKLFFNQYIILY